MGCAIAFDNPGPHRSEAVKWLLPVVLAFCLDGWLVDPRGGWWPVGFGWPGDEPFGVGLVGSIEDRLAGIDHGAGGPVVEISRVEVADA